MSFTGLGLAQARFRDIGNVTNAGDLPSGYASLVYRNGHFWQRFNDGIEQSSAGTWLSPWGDLPTNASTLAAFVSRSVAGANPIIDFAYGAGQYLAVPTSGSLFQSRDTFTWASTGSISIFTLRGVVYGNGLWVVIGNTQSATSRNLSASWTSPVTLPGSPGASLNRIFFLNNNFIIMSGSGYMATSTDGVNWTLRTTGVTTTLRDITWNGTVYCAVGGTSTTTTTIITSTDLVTWTPQTATGTTTLELRGVAVNASNRLCAVGESGRIITSDDNGVSWTTQTSGTTNLFLGVFWHGGWFFALEGATSIRWSVSGTSWSTVALTTNPTIGGYFRKAGKHLIYSDGIATGVGIFSRVNPGLTFDTRSLGLGMTEAQELSTVFEGTPIVQSTPTGTILRGQTDSARTTTIITSGSGRIGEVIRSYNAGSAVPTAGQWGEVGNITLTVGLWRIEISAMFVRNGATVAVNSTIHHGISTTVGNFSTGLSGGISEMTLTVVNPSATNFFMPSLSLTVRVAGTVITRMDDNAAYASGLILYHKMQFNGYTVATPQVTGKIMAVRIA